MSIRTAVGWIAFGLGVFASIANAQLAIDDKLVPPDGTTAILWTDLDAETLVVTQGQDRVLVYERTLAGWQIAQILDPPADIFAGQPTELIFRALVSGHTIAALVFGPVDPMSGMRDVATVFYSNLGGTWVLDDTLPDRSVVELAGDTAVVDPRGSTDVEFWSRVEGVWSLVDSVPSPIGHPNDNWRVNVGGFRGATAIGTADTDPDDVSNDTSAVYELREIGGSWTNVGAFALPDGNPPPPGDSLGLGPSAVGDDYLALGAPFRDGNGPNVGIGIVYVFARDQFDDWQFLESLQPRDLDPNDQFGSQVSIDGDRLLVAARGDDDVADGAGAVYVFERAGAEFLQVDKIVPTDGAINDQFGRLLGTSSERVAILSNNGPLGAVYTYGCGPDSEGDGLCDDWETAGIPYLDSNGDVQLYLLDIDGDGISDADPEVLDLFVEIDVMSGSAQAPNMSFGDDERTELEIAFLIAPVQGLAGNVGIALHLDIQQDVFPFELVTSSADGWPDNQIVRERRAFGTFGEQTATESEAILNAKAKAFRYGVAFHDVQITTAGNAGIGGMGELPGDDFVVYLSSFTDAEGRAAVTLHELGHTLGLRHGGGDDINGKPNYPSIMNYSLANRMTWNDAFWTLDFSREELAPLDEIFLDESTPIGIGASGFYDAWHMPVTLVVSDGSPCALESLWNQRIITTAPLDGTSALDWNTDCDAGNATGISQDLNVLYGPTLSSNPGDLSPGELLLGHDDWNNIRYAVSDGGGAFRGAKAIGEPTIELLDFVRNNLDPVPEPGLGVALSLGLLHLARLGRRPSR